MKQARSSEAGFTLVELLVAGTLGTVMIGVVLSFTLGTQRSWDQSSDQMDRTQNSRAALQMLTRDLQMAGSGFGGKVIVTGGVPQNRLFSLRTAYGPGTKPDTLQVVASLTGRQTTLTSSMGTWNAQMNVKDVTGFTTPGLVVVTDGTNANLFEISGANTQQKRLTLPNQSTYNSSTAHATWPANGGYPVGALVVVVERVSYWVEGTAGKRRMMRRTNGSGTVPVAGDVEELIMQYQMADGTWTASPNDLGLVTGVKVQCLTRADANGDPGDTLSVRVQPRVRSLTATGIPAGG